MIEIVDTPIDVSPLLHEAQTPAAGAVVAFLGTTRQFTGKQETQQLFYEAYREMARTKMGELEQVARDRWPIVHCRLIHRLGLVPLGEASVAVVVATPHRGEAFEAARWLIDTLKEDVPIWKQETFVTGDKQWVHPQVETGEKGASS